MWMPQHEPALAQLGHQARSPAVSHPLGNTSECRLDRQRQALE
jgi:hypothetical protein